VGLRSQTNSLAVAEDPIGLLRDTIERNGGRLNCVAHDLGVDRRRLYDKIYAWNLWPVVNQAREERRAKRLRRAASCRCT
jgi:hypothetical protein